MIPVWSTCPPLHPVARWLASSGSLTVRLQATGVFAVRPLSGARTRPTRDEQRALRCGRGCVYAREVCLTVDDVPRVVARTVASERALRGAWRGLSRLGRRSLGAVLLSHPLVQRGPLSFASLRPAHLVHRRFARHATLPSRLLARRSCFTLRGQRLLVMEAFLPAVADLKPPPAGSVLRHSAVLSHNVRR